MEIKDDAAFVATLTDDAQKTYYTNALKTASETAVETFKTTSAAERQKNIPQAYELKFADDAQLDKTDRESIIAFAKTKGYTTQEAQEFADQVQARTKALLGRQATTVTQAREQWATDTKADKEIGGDKFEESMKLANRAMERFVPKGSALRKELDDTGYGNHPEFVRLMVSIGKAMAEDKSPFNRGSGGGGADTLEGRARKIYTTMSS